MTSRLYLLACILICSTAFIATGCGGDDESSSGSSSNETTSNGTSGTSNGTSSTSNGTSSTSNGTSSTSNGTSSTSNGTSSTSNGTSSTSNGTTNPTEGLWLAVSDQARACEAVILDSSNVLTEVTFDGVNGRTMRRGERVAIAFHAESDASIEAGAVTFIVAQGEEESLQITVPRCFDSEGQVLDDATLAITKE